MSLIVYQNYQAELVHNNALPDTWEGIALVEIRPRLQS